MILEGLPVAMHYDRASKRLPSSTVQIKRLGHYVLRSFRELMATCMITPVLSPDEFSAVHEMKRQVSRRKYSLL
jgi:hypothetical protein